MDYGLTRGSETTGHGFHGQAHTPLPKRQTTNGLDGRPGAKPEKSLVEREVAYLRLLLSPHSKETKLTHPSIHRRPPFFLLSAFFLVLYLWLLHSYSTIILRRGACFFLPSAIVPCPSMSCPPCQSRSVRVSSRFLSLTRLCVCSSHSRLLTHFTLTHLLTPRSTWVSREAF